MARFVSPIAQSPSRRHPDRDYRADSLLPGRSTTTPAGYLYSAALALVLAMAIPLICLRFGPGAASPGAATAATIFAFVVTLLMVVIAIVCCWKGIRWRSARTAYSQKTGQPDLGYFGVWDNLGERSDEETLAQAEELVRANRAGRPE